VHDVDERDVVIKLSESPRPDVGAPLPLLVSDEHNLILAYLVSTRDPNWDGSYINVVTPESKRDAVAIIRFRQPYVHYFGPPNDEAFDGHPLASRGLHPYAAFEVRQSSWLRHLERMNSVHPHHNAELFLARRRHFVFAFHDSTFECIAEGFDCQIIRGSLRDALDRMASLVVEAWR
jgi:hypothetical protein